MDDLVGDIPIYQAYFFEEIGNIAFHSILLDSSIALNDHLYGQIVFFFCMDKVEDDFQGS